MSALPRSPIRYEVSMAARYRAEDGDEWKEGTLANLSVGGLCLVAPEATFAPGQSIELIVETTDKFLRTVPRRIRARVIWSRGGRHGVQFAKPGA